MPKSRKRKTQPKQPPQHANSKERATANYVGGKVELIQDVSAPSYGNVMEWMKDNDGRHVLFDFWARGNYTRRIIHHRKQGVEPLLVPVSYVDEMRWAYRRLALLGLPVEFVYCGQTTRSSKILHGSDMSPEFLWDAGWGYIATIEEKKERFVGWLLGYADLMPETLLDWLVDEACDDFVDGKVFIAPAEQIGINPKFSTAGLNRLADVTNGMPVMPDHEITQAAMELNMPYLDNMSSGAFKKFIADHQGELVRFQRAFRKLVSAREQSEGNLKDYLDELKYEIAELTVAQKHESTRRNIVKLGGMLGTFSASFAMAVQTNATSFSSLIGAAGMGAAALGLVDLWKQASEREQKMASNPYFILWKLGMTRLSEVKRSSKVNLTKAPNLSKERLRTKAHHWLCPPTPGVHFLCVKDKFKPMEGVPLEMV